MKRCPNCQRTYTDNSLSFCLQDGTPLLADVPPPPYNPPAYNATPPPRPRDTSAPGTATDYGNMPRVNQMRASPTWSPMPAPQPRKRSIWPWVIGGIAILGFMALGFLILIFAIAGMNTNSNRNRNSNSQLTNRNSNSNTNVASAPKPAFRDDFSTQNWGTGASAYGDIQYKFGEYHMHANKGGYMVMLGPNQNYESGTGTVRVTARSVDGVSPGSGYGLVVHAEKFGDKKETLHYAFLIRNDNKPAYKVIQNRGDNQTQIVGWTRSPIIRSGTSPNQIEVRTMNQLLMFYINGQNVTTFINKVGTLSGRVGLYTTDANEVAFDDLEIIR